LIIEGFDDLIAFVAIADTGSFTAAGSKLGRDPSVVSRRLSQLERRLGVRLMVRTTRSVTLTEAGQFYFRRIRSVMDEVAAANREVGDFAATPQGILKVSLPVTLGREVISPLLPDFLLKYPHIRIDAHFLDRTVDIVSEGFDIVVRVGAIRDSSLIARTLGTFRSLLVASPAYISAHGLPLRPEDVVSHSCLGFTNHPDWPNWVMEKDGVQISIRPEGQLIANSSELLLASAIKGVGISLIPDWMAAPYLAEGSLVEALPGWRTVRLIGVHAVMPPGVLVPAKTRAFVDEMVEGLRTAKIWLDQ
jgi:DNA-binding transcriptional LysR family regulator